MECRTRSLVRSAGEGAIALERRRAPSPDHHKARPLLADTPDHEAKTVEQTAGAAVARRAPGRQPARSLALSLSLSLTRLGFYRTIFWGYVGVCLLVFTFMVPPFQKSDEPAHYHRAVTLANGDLVCQRNPLGAPYFVIERRYNEFPYFIQGWNVAFYYDRKFDLSKVRTLDFSKPAFDQPVRVVELCNLAPAGYLPNVAGILMFKTADNPIYGFYMGRVLGAVFFVGCILLSLRIVPDRYRLLVYGYAAIPMVLHQVGAISYDAVHLALFPLVFAYFAKFLLQEERIRTMELLIFMGLILWTVNIRLFAYYPLVALYFVIPPSRIAGTFDGYLKLTGAYLGASAAVIGLFAATYLTADGYVGTLLPEIEPKAQLKHFVAEPWDFFYASYNTIAIHGSLLVRETFGVFGWIDYGFNLLVYYVVMFAFGILCYLYIREERQQPRILSAPQLVILWGTIWATVGMLFMSLYAVWNLIGSDIINGLQGRYFLGLLPFALVALSQSIAYVNIERLIKVVILVAVLALIATTVGAIWFRYY